MFLCGVHSSIPNDQVFDFANVRDNLIPKYSMKYGSSHLDAKAAAEAENLLFSVPVDTPYTRLKGILVAIDRPLATENHHNFLVISEVSRTLFLIVFYAQSGSAYFWRNQYCHSKQTWVWINSNEESTTISSVELRISISLMSCLRVTKASALYFAHIFSSITKKICSGFVKISEIKQNIAWPLLAVNGSSLESSRLFVTDCALKIQYLVKTDAVFISKFLAPLLPERVNYNLTEVNGPKKNTNGCIILSLNCGFRRNFV